jgi:FkbM family methyltransferase
VEVYLSLGEPISMLLPLNLNSLANNPLFLESDAGQSFLKSPLGFIDIGARGGAHDFVEPVAKLTAILGFEPDTVECERMLTTPAVYEPWAAFDLEPVALADKKDQAELFLLSAATNHSLLTPNSEFTERYKMDKWQVMGSEPLATELLDTVLFSTKKSPQRWGEIIKLDTQGTEFEILQGAKRTLDDRTVAIVTEVAFCELYKGQKLFSDVELLLRSHGFSFYGFPRIHGRSCKLLDKRTHVTAERAFYADAIFFKDPLPGAPQRKVLDDRGNYVVFTAALLLGYYDFALELASKTFASKADKLAPIKKLILQLAERSPVSAHNSVNELAQQVNNTPELANIMVGGFVDKHRPNCNYDDVLNATVSPKSH